MRRNAGREDVPKRVVLIIIVLGAAIGLTLILTEFRGPEVSDEGKSEENAKLFRRVEKLRSVPYTARTSPSPDSLVSGVIVHDRARAYPGYNLYCSRTASCANLMDMEGTIVHSWAYSDADTAVWEHAVMLPNGDLLATRKMKSLVRLDWGSNILREVPLEVHHEITPLPDGSVYTIERGVREYRGLEIRFPSIVRVSPDGRITERWSTYDNLKEIRNAFDQRSFLDKILDDLLAEGDSAILYTTIQRRPGMFRLKTTRQFFDYFHLNTVSMIPDNPLGRTDPRFKAGNLLICFRNVNQIGILDGETKKILWSWGEGELQWPHHPTMLDNGKILIFDNGVERRYSRVVELDPSSEKIVWEYVADPPGSFFTAQRGSAQRLPNGNTFICDGNNGRAFEVDRAGEIVWEWFDPNVRGGGREQLYRITRLSIEAVEPLLMGASH
jgi:hypothetical protein